MNLRDAVDKLYKIFNSKKDKGKIIFLVSPYDNIIIYHDKLFDENIWDIEYKDEEPNGI